MVGPRNRSHAASNRLELPEKAGADRVVPLRHGKDGMEPYRQLGSAEIFFPPHLLRVGARNAQELRVRAEKALATAETFRDPDTKRLMRQVAAICEELARRLERDARAADND